MKIDAEKKLGENTGPKHEAPKLDPNSTRYQERAATLARRMTLEEFERIVNTSPMSMDNKRLAHRVLVLGRGVVEVAEKHGVPSSLVSRACSAILARRPAPGSRYVVGFETFREWFADRVEPALTVDEDGFTHPGVVNGAQLRHDLDRWLQERGADIAFGPAQFGAMMAERGFRGSVMDGRTVYHGIGLKKPVEEGKKNLTDGAA